LIIIRQRKFKSAESVYFIEFLHTFLTKVINHTNKETDLKAPHPIVYGGVLSNLNQIFGGTQQAKVTGLYLIILRIALKCHMIYIDKSQLRIV
jgi:hypothetical protein